MGYNIETAIVQNCRHETSRHSTVADWDCFRFVQTKWS